MHANRQAYPSSCVKHAGVSQADDKTGDIAGSYSEIADRINLKTIIELKDELSKRQIQTCRIEHYIEHLEGRQSQFLKALYIEGKSVTQLSEELSLSETTIKNVKKDGLLQLLSMFNMVPGTEPVLLLKADYFWTFSEPFMDYNISKKGLYSTLFALFQCVIF